MPGWVPGVVGGGWTCAGGGYLLTGGWLDPGVWLDVPARGDSPGWWLAVGCSLDGWRALSPRGCCWIAVETVLVGWFLHGAVPRLAVGTPRRVAWFGAVPVCGGLLVPGVAGLRAVGSPGSPVWSNCRGAGDSGLVTGWRWWLVVKGTRKLVAVGWWCSPGCLLDGWRSPVRAG